MEQLIHIRQNIIGFYKKFEVVINYLLKFLVGLFVFSRINTLGMYSEDFNILFGGATEVAYLALLSLLFTISPPSVALFLVAAAVTIQLSAAFEVAVFVFLLMVLLIVFYARLSPRRSMLILAIIFGFYFHVPYAVVLFAGLFLGISSIIPIVIGTAIWYFLPFFTNLAASMAQSTEIMADIDLFDLPTVFMEVFAQIYAQLTTDFNWIVIGFVFAMMILAVHLISLIAVNYSKDIAIVVGAILGIITMTMVVLVIEIDMSIPGIIFGTLGSALLVWVIKFFDNVVDYKRVEHVTFDDDEYLYHVKIVPKVTAEATDVKTEMREIPRKKAAFTEPKHRAPKATPKPRPSVEEYGYRARMHNPGNFDDEE